LFLPSAALAESPEWMKYNDGLIASVEANKPVAVFIGQGKQGWEQLSREGKLDQETQKYLKANYVCVYLDAEEDARLASAFAIEGTGLVISDAGGRKQAFRHEGNLANDQLVGYLKKYSDPEREARFTESTQVRERPSYYYPPVQSAAPVCRT
jgi:hypothetical protein